MVDPRLVLAGVQIIGGIMGKSAADDAAARAEEIGRANAADLRELSGLNASEIRRIAGLNADAVVKTSRLNAESIREVAVANSMAHIDSTLMNMDLHTTENLELLRRHVIQELRLQAEIRGAYGASGVRVGQGSPIEVLDDAITSSYQERQYMGAYARKRLVMMGREGIMRAKLTMMDSDQRGKVLLETAALQASIMREEGASSATMMLRDAEANAKSLERGGQLIAMGQRAQGTASLISGIMSAGQTWLQYGGGSSMGGGTTSTGIDFSNSGYVTP